MRSADDEVSRATLSDVQRLEGEVDAVRDQLRARDEDWEDDINTIQMDEVVDHLVDPDAASRAEVISLGRGPTEEELEDAGEEVSFEETPAEVLREQPSAKAVVEEQKLTMAQKFLLRKDERSELAEAKNMSVYGGYLPLPADGLLDTTMLEWQRAAVMNICWPETLLECPKGSKTHRSILLLKKGSFSGKTMKFGLASVLMGTAAKVLGMFSRTLKRTTVSINVGELSRPSSWFEGIRDRLAGVEQSLRFSAVRPSDRVETRSEAIMDVFDLDSNVSPLRWTEVTATYRDTNVQQTVRDAASGMAKLVHRAGYGLDYVSMKLADVENQIGYAEVNEGLNAGSEVLSELAVSVEATAESVKDVVTTVTSTGSKVLWAAAIGCGLAAIYLAFNKSCRWWTTSKVLERIHTDNDVDTRPIGLSHTDIRYADPQLAKVELKATLYFLDVIPVWWTGRDEKIVSLELFSHLLGNNVIGYGLGDELVENKTGRVVATTHDINYSRYDPARFNNNVGENTGILSTGFHKMTSDANLYWLGKRQTPVIV